MDVFSHGLWGGIIVGRKSRTVFWLSCIFGIMPDILSFGIFSASTILGLSSGPDWSNGHPDMNFFPQYLNLFYNITHSLVIFAAVFGLVWLFERRPFWPLAAWAIHILIDIPTHSSQFFPTPFLWPVSNFKFNGINWGQPLIFIPNIIILVVLYVWFFYSKRNKIKKNNFL